MSRTGRVYRRCNRCARPTAQKSGRRCRRTPCPGEVRWALVIDVAPEGAKRRRVARTGFATKGEADAALGSLKAEISSNGAYKAPERISVGAYLNRWLEARSALIGSEIRESTYRENRRHIEQYIKPHLGTMQVRRLDRTSIRAWAARLRLEGGQRGRSLSAQTVANAVRTLSRALGDALDDGLIQTNPALGAWKVRADSRTEMSVWLPAHVRIFLNAVANDRFAALWQLAIATGARRGELCGLKWGDFTDDFNRLRIDRALVSGDGGHHFVPPKTRSGRRTMKLDPDSISAIRKHRTRLQEERMAKGLGRLAPDAPVFTDQSLTEHVRPDVVSSRFRDLSDRLDVPRIRFHDLRHTAASILIADGTVPVNVISRRLGHAKPSITLDVYGHVFDEHGQAAADAMERALGGLSG